MEAYRSKRHILDLHVCTCCFAAISKQVESVLECNIWVRQLAGYVEWLNAVRGSEVVLVSVIGFSSSLYLLTAD